MIVVRRTVTSNNHERLSVNQHALHSPQSLDSPLVHLLGIQPKEMTNVRRDRTISPTTPR